MFILLACMVKKAYILFFGNTSLLLSVVISLLLLVISLFVNAWAGRYADESGTRYVTDIVLSNTNVYDVGNIFVYGTMLFFLFLVVWCLRYPAQIPYIVKSIATFVLIRSVFISLTHLGPFPDHLVMMNDGIVHDFMNKINFWADLFFSGHTGLPFLMALIFWDHKWLRYIFIAWSLFFGGVVLLGHLHYSIDVLSAFFITYSINHICELLWAKDKRYFQMYDSIIYPQ